MNFPNALTLARIVLIFVFIILAANAGEPLETFNSSHVLRIIAYLVALVAAFTDLADGYFARKWNQVTDIGKLMDPLADKIFVSAIMLMMVQYQLLPAWVAVVIVSREFLVTGLRMLALQKNTVIAADIWGKIKILFELQYNPSSHIIKIPFPNITVPVISSMMKNIFILKLMYLLYF